MQAVYQGHGLATCGSTRGHHRQRNSKGNGAELEPRAAPTQRHRREMDGGRHPPAAAAEAQHAEQRAATASERVRAQHLVAGGAALRLGF